MDQPVLENTDLSLAELMTRWPQTVRVFLRHRMLCIGCPVGPFHTVTDACQAYGLDEASFLRELRDAVEQGRKVP